VGDDPRATIPAVLEPARTDPSDPASAGSRPSLDGADAPRLADARRGSVLGHPLDPIELDDAAERLIARARRGPVATVVTLNPEIIVRARHDAALTDALAAADLSVPDGVGVVWAARRTGLPVPGRVPGVELAERLLELAGDELPVFLLGGKPGVAERAAAEAVRRYGTRIVGTHDGYFAADDDAEVARQVADSGARLLLAGLGERQERFLHEHRGLLGPLVAIGVGGTLDVFAGEARRTPAWTRRLGLEWAWRVGLDPARWHRAPRLARFVLLALRAPRRRPTARR
jgi:N-acetylglucosaminyldiphosphoundecaprenol N-acetyl-beta-D-mannosaminyltransferase